ncbi:MAG: aspartate/glutamate racemase family protein, partial [Bacillota bacterium]|nr:aspartate/glutamate racemase family protein [Bacillota bacterium]
GGPESIESAYDEVTAGPYILTKAKQAEEDGFDVIIVYCGSDPAVTAARELVNIPVVGPGMASKLVALDLGYRFSVLTVLDSTVARDTEAVYEKGFGVNRLASVRSIGIPVSNVRDDMDATFRALYNAGKKCIEEDGAHCIVLSCLGMAGMGDRLTEALKIPVLDPAPIAVKYAELLASLKLSASRLSYPRYEKEINA